MNSPLYIGLNGYAGSGKDSVAKMLKVILNALNSHYKHGQLFENSQFISKENCYNAFKQEYPNIKAPSTENGNISGNTMVIAFADQLKEICSNIFGIPVSRFYYNKSNAWVCINKDFKYTEQKPQNIVTAEEFYLMCMDNNDNNIEYYMSLREILVYVGKYILQGSINKNTFINIVNNKIKEQLNNGIDYVIITDVRFPQELQYMSSKYSVMINIVRPGLEQLSNIAEHELDDESDYDFTIINDGSYKDLFYKVYDLIANNIIFKNKCINLVTRDGTNNFLRYIDNDRVELCTPYPLLSLERKEGNIISIEPVGGPVLEIGDVYKYIYMNTINLRFILDLHSDTKI